MCWINAHFLNRSLGFKDCTMYLFCCLLSDGPVSLAIHKPSTPAAIVACIECTQAAGNMDLHSQSAPLLLEQHYVDATGDIA